MQSIRPGEATAGGLCPRMGGALPLCKSDFPPESGIECWPSNNQLSY